MQINSLNSNNRNKLQVLIALEVYSLSSTITYLKRSRSTSSTRVIIKIKTTPRITHLLSGTYNKTSQPRANSKIPMCGIHQPHRSTTPCSKRKTVTMVVLLADSNLLRPGMWHITNLELVSQAGKMEEPPTPGELKSQKVAKLPQRVATMTNHGLHPRKRKQNLPLSWNTTILMGPVPMSISFK